MSNSFGAVNVRDVGASVGHPAIAPRRLIRSETPELFAAADVDRAIDDLGVSLVVDLRSPRQPRDESGELGRRVQRKNIDMVGLAGNRLPDDHERESGHWLASVASTAGPAWVAFLRAVVGNRSGATLVHCHSGKDRTGLMVALTLRLCGVPDDRIIADYLASAAVHDQLVANLERAGMWDPKAPVFARAPANQGAIANLLAYLDEAWPDLGEFVLAHGGDRHLIDAVRRRLGDVQV